MSLNMDTAELIPKSLSFQWDFYERAVNNYSIIMRILNFFNDEDGLVTSVPKIFVEESLFDMCKIVHSDSGIIREGFFSLDDTLVNMDVESVRELSGEALSPTLATDVFGYGTLYVYPLRKDIQVFGFLVLGKKSRAELDRRLLTELEIVCDIYNKSVVMIGDLQSSKKKAHDRSLYEKALDEFPDALLLIDRNGFICFANKRAKSEFESSKGLLLGERIDNIISGLADDFYRGEGALYGEINYRVGDRFKIFKTDSYPVPDRYKKAGWRGIIFRDVVEKKIRDEEHLVKEKMDGIGMLAGGIAHDFNNLLTGVLGYASLIKNFLSKEQKLFKYAEAIEHSAQRAAKLTQHLLNFSRRQRRKTGIVDLNMLLDDILFLIKESFRDIEVDRSLQEFLPPIKGDEAELQNVFLNLCMNAKDAMGGAGTLHVRTERRRYMGSRDFAVVQIEDTGKGIDEKIRAQIFEPYFTTKETSNNLGMGLYLVDKIVREHGGFIELESELGKGTRFTLYLPLPLDAVDRAPIKEEMKDRSAIQRQTILIVDDEDVIRGFLRGVLSEEDVKLYEAMDGTTAIKIFEKHKDEINLVILDIIMPGMKGDEVLRVLREIRPDIKVIVCSGFMSEEQRDKLKEYHVDAFLDKPFRDKDVIRTIIGVLPK
jgi:signal transduction histidine kinase